MGLQRSRQAALNIVDFILRRGGLRRGGSFGLRRRLRFLRAQHRRLTRRRRAVLILAHHARCHDRYPHPVAQALVECRADNNIGVGIDFLPDARSGFIYFIKCQFTAAADR